MPTHMTRIRTTTNSKTKNNQDCQKIELYGSLTTKELKKKHSFRQVGGAETSQAGGAEKTRWQGSSWWAGAGEVEAGGAGSPTLACG